MCVCVGIYIYVYVSVCIHKFILFFVLLFNFLLLSGVNTLEPSGNFSCHFQQCYSYESTIMKWALLG